MRDIIESITCGEPRRIVKPVIWSTVAQLAWFLPFVCLVLIVERMFGFYATDVLDGDALWLLWATMAVGFALSLVVENIACRMTFRGGYDAGAAGRARLAEHIRKLPLGKLDARGTGSVATTMMDDFSRVETGMTHLLPQTISAAIAALVTAGALCFVDWRMGLALFVGLPLALAVLAAARGLQKHAERHLSAAKVEQTSRLQEYLRGMRVIKAYRLQGSNFAALARACEGYRDACVANEAAVGSLGGVAEALLRSGLACMTFAGACLVVGGGLGPAEFALFLLVGTRALEPLDVALTSWPELQACAAAGQRIVELLGEPEMPGEARAPIGHDIALEHVSFSYGGNEVLHDVSLKMGAGRLTALVGPSGSGKSTILRLAARFWDPQAGRVLIGGVDARSVQPDSLLSQMAVVFQDVYLFQDTVEANIRYGRSDATHEEVVRAAKAAHCYDFIQALPKGFDTIVGEGGSTLSGGERQRISIARALLKDAPIVLLDEATSALDPENKAEVQEAIGALVRGRTVVVIAHRLRTVVDADAIYVIEGGRVAESGTHMSLLAQGGLYARLWEIQTDLDTWRENSPHEDAASDRGE
ncbi:MAG: ABC transporter ATP-binding protein/permease [Coriobacteriaceae bacterium]|nr:ABC transporter ATP-binding protein/permease [Coriobacteriaceae bacterium]